MTSRPTLSVVVCVYTQRRWEAIQAAVRSVQAQQEPVHELIVVVDHEDELLRRLEVALPGVQVVASTGRQGLSGARNTGVAAATGDVVAFLDDDAAAEPDWSRLLLDAYASPEVIGVGGGVVPAWLAPRPAWLPEEFLWTVGCSYTGQPQGRARVRNGIGANLSFRRDVLEQAGRFNEDLGRIGADAAGCEETEFSIRAGRAFPDGVILLEPAARVHHEVTPDRVTRGYFRRRCAAEGRSKAFVSGLAGPEQALSTERTYVTRTLPGAVLRGVASTLRTRDTAGVRQALAVIEGLLITGWAYVRERQQLRSSPSVPEKSALGA